MATKVRVAVAGRGTMGAPLLTRLEDEGFPIACSFTSTAVWDGRTKATLPRRLKSEADIAETLDCFMDGVEVMFLAIPSGPQEIPLIKYCLSRKIYTILFCKHALAYHYRDLRPHRFMIGANATVGGRTMSLPWLRMQYLDGKRFVIYAVWNASANFWFDDIANHYGSESGSFGKAQMLRLAEPGSSDYISFLNGEIGGDYPKKISIAMNDAMLGDGPYITPDTFSYVPFGRPEELEEHTLGTANDRYLVRIDNTGANAEFAANVPGSLYARHGDFTVRGGFCDLSRDTSITKWIKGGEMNGVQIRFKGEHGYEGHVEVAGLGAGPATVGAAMNDLYEYIRARDRKLLEASWPERKRTASA